MKIGIIGGGVMAEAIVRNLLEKKIVEPSDVVVSEIVEQRRVSLHSIYSIKVVTDNSVAIKGAEVVILAVKPQDFAKVAESLKDKILPEQLVLSIMAGVTLEKLVKWLNHKAVVRSMPNMPAQIGEGITVWVHTPEVDDVQMENAKKILGGMGEEILLQNEKYIDMATAISGSGPAYIYLIIEALTDAGVHIGLSRALAEKLAVDTMIGSARTIKVMRKHPAELRNMVTSPGGTTTEGLFQLESGGLRSLFLKAVIAAYEKARNLSTS